MIFRRYDTLVYLGSGCGSVGRAVASDTRDPWFEPSHRQNNFLSTVLKDKDKEAGNGQFFGKN